MRLILLVLFFTSLSFADVKISELPLGSGAAVAAGDSFPYVVSGVNITKRLTIYDLINVPVFGTTYAKLASPTFTGVVTSPSFVGALTGNVTGNVVGNVTGSLTGNASTATALAANPTDCSSNQYAIAIAANGNLTCSSISAATDISGTLAITHGGTGQTSFTSGYIKSNGTTLSSSSTVATSDLSGAVAIANGGTNNASLGVTAGGVIYADGSKLVNSGVGTSGQYLKSNASSAPAWASFISPTVQKFTSSSGTYTTPAGVLYIHVKMVGGGSGGSGSGTGSPGNSSAAGNTTFGTTLLVANGGGATAIGSGAGGAGGTASLGAASGVAVSGQAGSSVGNAAQAVGGNGGQSALGGAGVGSGGGSGAVGGAAATNSGSGGGGPGTGASIGAGVGGGAGGYVDAIIISPSGTYSYAVGAGTSGGTAGTGGQAGGAGAAGQIIVEEFYQ